MIDREKVLTVLKRRFPTGTADQLAAAANAIVGLEEEWEEFRPEAHDAWFNPLGPCIDACLLHSLSAGDFELRIYRRRIPSEVPYPVPRRAV